MEKLLIDPKPKYLPLYEPMKPTLPSKYTEYPLPSTSILPPPTTLPSTSIPVSDIPKKSYSYSVIIGIVVLVCFKIGRAHV